MQSPAVDATGNLTIRNGQSLSGSFWFAHTEPVEVGELWSARAVIAARQRLRRAVLLR